MKLFIAGCESRVNRICNCAANNPYMLLSYYHLTNGKHKMDKNFVYDYHRLKSKANFIIDSGLFTMMFGAGSDKTYSYKELEDYTHKYIDNINRIKYKDYIVEMDVHKVLGMKELEKFRKIFIKKYDINKTIFVWHIEEEIKGWEEMCKKYPFVAISVPELRIVLKQKYLKDFINKLIRMALEINPNIKIHLLGCTSNDLLEQGGYYSADSTSWMSALRYGEFTIPHNKLKLNSNLIRMIANNNEDKVTSNIKVFENKYDIINTDKNTERINLSTTCIALFRYMAENVNKNYFNKKYPVFDEDIELLIERV